MALRRELPLKVSERKYMVGFEYHVRTYLTPRMFHGVEIHPTPDYVRKVLRGDVESRRLLLDIFQNCPGLMEHPSVSKSVSAVWEHWREHGSLPPTYGNGRRAS